jgi:hypothetical protein
VAGWDRRRRTGWNVEKEQARERAQQLPVSVSSVRREADKVMQILRLHSQYLLDSSTFGFWRIERDLEREREYKQVIRISFLLLLFHWFEEYRHLYMGRGDNNFKRFNFYIYVYIYRSNHGCVWRFLIQITRTNSLILLNFFDQFRPTLITWLSFFFFVIMVHDYHMINPKNVSRLLCTND